MRSPFDFVVKKNIRRQIEIRSLIVKEMKIVREGINWVLADIQTGWGWVGGRGKGINCRKRVLCTDLTEISRTVM